jgi:hypothetical protein
MEFLKSKKCPPVAEAELLKGLNMAFPTFLPKSKEPWEILFQQLLIPVKISKEMISLLDIGGVKRMTVDKIKSLKDHENLFFYAGLFTISYEHRFKQHQRIKKNLCGCQLKLFNNFGVALISECATILMLKGMAAGKQEIKIKACLNNREGFDSPSLYKSYRKRQSKYLNPLSYG